MGPPSCRHLRDRLDSVDLPGGAKTGWRGPGARVGCNPGIQSDSRVLLAGSPQLHHDDSTGAGVVMVLRAGGRAKPRNGLGLVDRVRRPGGLQSLLRVSVAGSASLLFILPQETGPVGATGRPRSGDSGPCRAWAHLCAASAAAGDDVSLCILYTS